MASAKKAKASAKLLFPEPFCPTRKVGLSNSTTSAGRLRNRFKINLRSIGLDMGFSPRCPFQLICIEGRPTNRQITGYLLGLRTQTASPQPAYIMPSVAAFDNGSCGQTVRIEYELKMMGDKPLACQTRTLAISGCPELQPGYGLSLGPVLKNRAGAPPTPYNKLHPHAYAASPNLRATASEAAFSHEVLYSGTRPDARTVSAHAAATCEPSPRPRNAAAVSNPASAAVSERRAQKQTLTAWPSSTTATIGARPGISAAVQPAKWRASNGNAFTSTVVSGSLISSGKANAGPEYTFPPASALYRSACTGTSRKPATGGSSPARASSSSATSRGTSVRTAQAQLDLPRISANFGPGSGSGSRVPRIRPALSNRNRVRR